MSSSGGSFGSAVPSGPASGDLAGQYPGPSVAKVQGRGVSATAPTDGQGLVWNAGLGLWVPTTFNNPAPSGTVTGPDAFGAAAAAGVAATFSRGDHDHGLPANPVQFAAPAIALGAAAAVGAAGTVIRSDATIAAFDATAPVVQAFGDAAAAGAIAFAAHRDHRHGMPATPVTSLNGGTGAIAQANGYGISGANSNPPAPAVSLTSSSVFLGVDTALANGVITNLVSLILAAGTWRVTGLAQVQDTGVEATPINVWIGETSGSASNPLDEASDYVGALAGAHQRSRLSVHAVVVLASSTTIYLIAEAASANVTVLSVGRQTAAKPTGIIATRQA